MEKALDTIKAIPKLLTSKRDDDFLDRLSSQHTTIMLVVFAVIVSVQTYVGEVITCWVPVHITKHQTKYVNSYCWVRNTYYVPFGERMPKWNEPREHVILYYQWVPFILLLQAACFYFPSVFWHGLNQLGGVDCDNILETAHKLTYTPLPEKKKDQKKDETAGNEQGDAKEEDMDKGDTKGKKKKKKEDDDNPRKKNLKLITNQIDRFLKSRLKVQRREGRCNPRAIVRLVCKPCGRRSGNYLVLLFLFSKLLYFANVIGQLFLLNAVLSTKYNLYGFELVKYLASDEDWTGSPDVVFPRVTFCDFDIRRLGNLHRYTVQCTLPINMYTEKIYMFLWFWMVFIAFMTIIGFGVWLMRAILRSDKLKFVGNHLSVAGRLDKSEDTKMMPDFVDDYLAQDGVFVLRLIAHNTNNITVTDIMCSLWDKYKESIELKGTYINAVKWNHPIGSK